jgi:hypothetical protein
MAGDDDNAADRPEKPADETGTTRHDQGLSPRDPLWVEHFTKAAGGRTVHAELGSLVDKLVACRSDQQEGLDADQRDRLNDPAGSRARKLARRRIQARRSVRAVLAFLEAPAVVAAEPRIVEYRATLHLADLAQALEELEANVPADLFELPPDRQRKAGPKPSLVEARLRGRAVAAVEMLVRAGDERKRAIDLVVEALKAGEYHTPRGRKSGRADPITSTTVGNWCKEVGKAGKGDPTRRTCDRLIADAERAPRGSHAGREPRFWRYFAQLTLRELTSGNPEGPTYEIALEPVATPEK